MRNDKARFMGSSALIGRPDADGQAMSPAHLREVMEDIAEVDRVVFVISAKVRNGQCWTLKMKGVELFWMNAAGLVRAKREAPDAFEGPLPTEVVNADGMGADTAWLWRVLRERGTDASDGSRVELDDVP